MSILKFRRCKDGSIYYNGSKVIDIKTIKKCYKGDDRQKYSKIDVDLPKPENDIYICYDWYYVYVCSEKLSNENKKYYNDTNYLEDTVLYFDGHPMTDAHIHFKIVKPYKY